MQGPSWRGPVGAARESAKVGARRWISRGERPLGVALVTRLPLDVAPVVPAHRGSHCYDSMIAMSGTTPEPLGVTRPSPSGFPFRPRDRSSGDAR